MDKYLIILAVFIVTNIYSQNKEYSYVSNILDSVYITDQFYRLQMDSVSNEFGFNSKQFKDLLKKEEEQDSLNLLIVKTIISDYGWLGESKIGYRGNKALFLVVQHSSPEDQEYFLPILKKAVKRGNVAHKDLALLQDRIATNKGEYQIYGSQLITVPDVGNVFYPIADFENVNSKRKLVGLKPIEEYAKGFGIKWTIQTYLNGIKELKKFTTKYSIPFPKDI